MIPQYWIWGILLGILGYIIFLLEIPEKPFNVQVQISSQNHQLNIEADNVMECLMNHITRQKLRQVWHRQSSGYEILEGNPRDGMKLINYFSGIEVEIRSEVDLQNNIVKYFSTTPISTIDVEYKIVQLQENKLEVTKYVKQYQPLFFTMLNYKIMRDKHKEFVVQLSELLQMDPRFCYLENDLDQINEKQQFKEHHIPNMHRIDRLIQDQLEQVQNLENFQNQEIQLNSSIHQQYNNISNSNEDITQNNSNHDDHNGGDLLIGKVE